MKTALLIMAAGIGSRFGGGIKQLAAVDSQNHIIMDYSIHDAIAAGFDKIVFVIRRDIEKDFREIIGNRIEAVCKEQGVEVCYVFQCLEDIPIGFIVPEERRKPWGTGHAVLSAKECITEPFVVINADDYYGKEAFVKLHDYLETEAKENQFCMAGFVLKNTLSDNGGVTRGICKVDDDGFLKDIAETPGIEKVTDPVTRRVSAVVNGNAVDANSCVSMNMWGLTPEFMEMLEKGFREFFETKVREKPEKAEFLIPIFIGQLLKDEKVSVKILETNDKWFGVTYQEDRELVIRSIQELISAGVYAEDLYTDLPQTVK